MKYLIYLAAVTLTGGIFIYTLSFSRWLFRKKQYRGSIGVAFLAVIALIVPLYTLFKGR